MIQRRESKCHSVKSGTSFWIK